MLSVQGSVRVEALGSHRPTPALSEPVPLEMRIAIRAPRDYVLDPAKWSKRHRARADSPAYADAQAQLSGHGRHRG
jgi:hypothetical protein